VKPWNGFLNRNSKPVQNLLACESNFNINLNYCCVDQGSLVLFQRKQLSRGIDVTTAKKCVSNYLCFCCRYLFVMNRERNGKTGQNMHIMFNKHS
jgi:hypothetical protein